MKILHIHDKLAPIGGVQRYISDLNMGLKESGHESIAVRICNKKNDYVYENDYVIRSYSRILRGIRTWASLKDIIIMENPDIIHLHSVFTTRSPYIMYFLKRMRPTVYTLHDVKPLCHWGTKIRPGQDTVCTTPLGITCLTDGCYSPFSNGSALKDLYNMPMRHLFLRVCKTLDRVIVANTYFYEELMAYGFPEERLALIPLFTDKETSGWETPSGERIILFVGRLSEEKGVIPFIKMLHLIRDREWMAEVLGEGPQLIEAQRLAEALQLKKRIVFRGALSSDEMDKHYARCRLVVVPSMVPENFCLVGVEAMAFGKPVVGFRLGGIPEWLRDKINGFLVDPGDLQSMSEKVLLLLEDQRLSDQLGQRGREIVEREFQKSLHIKRLFDVYEEAIGTYTGGYE